MCGRLYFKAARAKAWSRMEGRLDASGLCGRKSGHSDSVRGAPLAWGQERGICLILSEPHIAQHRLWIYALRCLRLLVWAGWGNTSGLLVLHQACAQEELPRVCRNDWMLETSPLPEVVPLCSALSTGAAFCARSITLLRSDRLSPPPPPPTPSALSTFWMAPSGPELVVPVVPVVVELLLPPRMLSRGLTLDAMVPSLDRSRPRLSLPLPEARFSSDDRGLDEAFAESAAPDSDCRTCATLVATSSRDCRLRPLDEEVPVVVGVVEPEAVEPEVVEPLAAPMILVRKESGLLVAVVVALPEVSALAALRRDSRLLVDAPLLPAAELEVPVLVPVPVLLPPRKACSFLTTSSRLTTRSAAALASATALWTLATTPVLLVDVTVNLESRLSTSASGESEPEALRILDTAPTSVATGAEVNLPVLSESRREERTSAFSVESAPCDGGWHDSWERHYTKLRPGQGRMPGARLCQPVVGANI